MMILIPRITKRYLFYLYSQRWIREQLVDYQDKKLRHLIRYAGKYVPYYRKLFKSINFDPEKFRGSVDMNKIPLLDKEIVRTHKNEFISDIARKFVYHWESTSGTSGTPLHLIVDNSTEANKIAALLRCFKWAGYTIGKKAFSLQSYYLKDKVWEFKRFYNVLRFDSVKLGKDSAVKVIKQINVLKPKFFMGFPFDLLILSQFAAEEGLSIHTPDSIVAYGETLSKSKKDLLESAYGCKVFNFYSLHESNAMIAECEHRNLHLIDDFAFHEIVDEKGNDTLKKGEGELIATGLYNYVMPLIRYKTRDRLILENEKISCKCGRNFRIVKEIIGKQCDYIETPDGRLLGSVMSHSIDNAKGVVCSQCIQDTIDHLYINIVIDDTFNDDSQKALEEGLRKRIGNEMKLDFKVVTQLEKSEGGKTPFIMSKIGNKYI